MATFTTETKDWTNTRYARKDSFVLHLKVQFFLAAETWWQEFKVADNCAFLCREETEKINAGAQPAFPFFIS